MVFCIAAWIVFGILGIFSAKYRKYAKESFSCFFRTLTLRKCESGFDEQMKMKAAVRISKHSPALGKIVREYFQTISWIFVFIMLASLGYTLFGLYNFVQYGNCEGTQPYSFCALNPESYGFAFNFPWTVKPVPLRDSPSIGLENAPVQVVEVGCFTCPYTRKAEPLVEQLLKDYNGKIHFSFKYFPLPSHPYSLEAAQSAECAHEQEKFWEYKQSLFAAQTVCEQEDTHPDLRPIFLETAKGLDLNLKQFQQCVDENRHMEFVLQSKQDSIDAGIYGTPTFYINGKVLVSPQTYAELQNSVEEALRNSK